MTTYRELLAEGKACLKRYAVPDGELDAWLLLEAATGRDRSWYFAHMGETVEEDLAAVYCEMLRKRRMRIPLQYITGKAWFMGLEFHVNEHVLIPRQDTEVLVEQALSRLEGGEDILDLCTGSGCILLSLLYNNSRASGVGVDISARALAVARGNQQSLKVERVRFLQGDLFAPVQGRYHMIVSNPPYIPPKVIESLMEEVRDYEPHVALDGGEDGLVFYRRIISQAEDYLYPGGWLLMEIGSDQAADVIAMLKKRKYDKIEVVKDLAGLDRVVIGRVRQEEPHV